jgi:hypothetical protein
VGKKAPITYRSFSKNGPVEVPQGSEAWWKAKEEAISAAVSGLIEYLRKNQQGRELRNMTSARLYGNLSLAGMSSLTHAKLIASETILKDRLTYNVVQSTIDTVVARLSKNKPRPLFLTSGGDYKIQRRAKKLDKFVEGVFYENDQYALSQKACRDGAIFGTGVTKVFESYGRVRHERRLPSQLVVDEVEAFDGRPRQIHEVMDVDRGMLMELFPSEKKLIKSASCDQLDGYSNGAYSDNVADVVTVRESWRLPSGPEAQDGLHVFTVNNGTLGRPEKWEFDFFPFATFHWNDPLIGFWGQGLSEMLQGIQLEINKLLILAQRSFHLAGSFKILLENTAKIVEEHLTNEVGAVIRYTNTKPEYVVPPVLPPEYLTHLWNLKNAAFDIAGISQLSAAGQKPAGLNSGKALREMNDIQSDRYTSVSNNYDRYHLDVARLDVAVGRKIFEKSKKYQVKVPGRKFVETIDWKEINLKDDEFVMKIFPISSLPTDPAGRLATVQEYIQAGFLSPRVGRRLLDTPDLEAAEDMANAPEDWIHECLETILEDGKYVVPEPQDDLMLAKELASEYYAYAKVTRVEEKKLALIRKYAKQVQFYIDKATPPQPALPPGGAAPPQANPEPTPTSALIPNIPGKVA